MSGWGCPHEENGNCRKVPGKQCDPGMKGCALANRFRFANDAKNISKRFRKEGLTTENTKDTEDKQS